MDYPTEQQLKDIEEWPTGQWADLIEFVKSIYWRKEMINWIGDDTIAVSTGGWSGNESIIGALKRNRVFWAMCWQQSRRGGHYIFDHIINYEDNDESSLSD